MSWYLKLSQQPLQILIFLTPFIIVYELGMWRHLTDTTTGQTKLIDVSAYEQINFVFELFGVNSGGWYLPGIMLIVVLITLQILQRQSWRLHLGIPLVMFIESFILALPLLVFDQIIRRLVSSEGLPAISIGNPCLSEVLSSTDLSSLSWQTRLILSIGAGLYEELLFRMILIAVIHSIGLHVFKISHNKAALAAIVISAVGFMFYHPQIHVAGEIQINLVIFYLISGVYFGWLYVARGFGIAAGTHALYDIMVIILLPLLAGVKAG